MPEVKQAKGLIHTSIQNENKDAWAVHVDLSIGNSQKTRRSGAGVGIFYLKNIDESDHLDGMFGYT